MHKSWEQHPALIRFAVTAASSAQAVREPAFRVIDALQQLPVATQVDALFAAAVMVARGAGLDPHDLVTRAKRQVPDVEFGESAVNAISDYAKGELRS